MATSSWLASNAILLVGFLLFVGFVCNLMTVEALKHNYYTKRDSRGLIGPLGFPFGFLDGTGHYNLTVYDFQLKAPKNRHKHKDGELQSLAKDGQASTETKPELKLEDVLNNIKGVGFLLKKFKDEQEFYGYMNLYQEYPGSCIFQPYLDETSDTDVLAEPSYYYDDDVFEYTTDDAPYDYEESSYGAYYGGYGADDYSTDDVRRRRKFRARRLDDEGSGVAFYDKETNNLEGIFLDMLPRTRWKPNNPTVSYNFLTGEGGFYFLIYQICYDVDTDATRKSVRKDNRYHIHSEFELDFHFSNKDMFGRTSYLSSGEMVLPWMFFLFSIVYGVCLYIWWFNIKLAQEGKPGYLDTGDPPAPPRPGMPATTATIYPIHYLMAFLLGLKFCSLLFESIRYHYLRVTGHAVFFSAVYYAFAFLKGITLFTVILLIGSGWSFVKPFLSDREKKMIFGILILQAINNVAIVVLTQETEGEVAFDRWTAVLHLVDILCCCAVLIPIVWQVNQLEKNIEQNQHKGKDDTGMDASEEDSFIGDDRIPEDELDDVSNGNDGESEPIPDARMAAKLKTFRSFYILVISYIYMTRIVVYLFAAILNYQHTWIRVFVVELTTIAFYTSVGYMFRPVNENTYSQIRKRRRDTEEGQVEMRKIDPSTKAALD